MKQNRIFIVEDDRVISEIIQEELQKWEFETCGVTDFQQVLAEFQTFEPHLVLLDISLPYFNGYHWCQEIRKHSNVPIVFLSSANDKMNMMMAMNMGGDDFMAKPVDLDLLVAKLQAIFRRTYTFNESETELVYQELRLSLVENEIRYRQQAVSVTPNEAKILALLFTNAEKIDSWRFS